MKNGLPAVTLLVAFLACAVIYFPVSFAAGWIEPMWSGRLGQGPWWSLLDSGICLLLCCFFAFCALVGPMSLTGFLGEGSWFRALGVGLLWSLPSLGFAYFIGDFRGPFQLYDFGVAVVIPPVAAAIFYWRTQDWLSTTLLAGAGLFFGIFLISDLLGPFPSFVKFAIHQGPATSVRSALAVLGLVLVAFLPLRENPHE